MKKLRYFLSFLLVCVGVQAFALSNNDELSELAKERVRQEVAQLTDNISSMADKSKTESARGVYREMALSLFVAKGEPFEEEGIQNAGVKMETTSTSRPQPVRKLMKNYFSGLIKLKYQKVTIQSTKFYDIKVSDLQKVDENKYVCTACFEQIFIGYRDGIPVYKDRTRKRVKVYVVAEETVDGIEFLIRLGDVTALETQRI